MGRILRRVVRRTIRALIRARLLVVLLLGLALVAVAAGLFQSVQLPGGGLSLPGPRRAPDSTEAFLKGNQTYNADLICGSLSDDTLAGQHP